MERSGMKRARARLWIQRDKIYYSLTVNIGACSIPSAMGCSHRCKGQSEKEIHRLDPYGLAIWPSALAPAS